MPFKTDILLYTAALCAVFTALVDLAAGSFFYLFELFTLFTAVLLLLYLWGSCRLLPTKIWALYRSCLPHGGFLVLGVAAYLLIDILSLTYSPALNYALPKYPPVFAMAVVALALTLCLNTRKRILQTLTVVGAAGLLAAALAVLNYIYPLLYPLAYSLRLSLRADYNMFAMVVLIGMFCACYSAVLAQIKPLTLCIVIGLCCMLGVPVIILSGSRRAVLLLTPILLVLAGAWLYKLFIQKSEGISRFVFALITVLVLVSESFANIAFMGGYMRHRYEQFGEQGSVALGSGGSETSLDDRYESIGEAGLFTKRALIWRLGLQNLQTYTLTNWLVGRGAGYDILLYDTLNDPQLKEAYKGKDLTGALSAHNFLLADLLNGGLLRLIITVFVLFELAAMCFLLLRKNPLAACLYIAMLAVVGVQNLISNRYGLLYDKTFWLFVVLLLANLNYFAAPHPTAQNGESL